MKKMKAAFYLTLFCMAMSIVFGYLGHAFKVIAPLYALFITVCFLWLCSAVALAMAFAGMFEKWNGE